MIMPAPPRDPYRDIFLSSPNGAYRRTAQGHFLEANPALATLFGYESTEDFLSAMDRDPAQYYADPDSREAFLAALSASGMVADFECQALRRDMTVIWIAESGRLVDAGRGNMEVVGFTREITAEKSAVWALREAEDNYRNIFENAVEGLFQSTPLDRFVTVNAALAHMLGHADTGALLAMRSLGRELFVDPSDKARLDRELAEKGVVRGFEAEVRRGDGGRTFLSFHARAVRDASGAVVLHEGSVIDVTERRRARTLLEESLSRTHRLFLQTAASLARTVEFRDAYTAGHQRNVADLAVRMAGIMGLEPERVAGLKLASELHDIGKIAVPVRYLTKPGKLDAHEWAFMREHPEIGFAIIGQVEFPWPVARMILEHHERLDGSGYPQGLRGDRILLESRIMAVADVLDAMGSHRPYRPALGVEAALGELLLHRGDRYDPDAVDAAETMLATSDSASASPP